jgi:(p)ppGpp synthase/HD superfamily hydrolase
MFLTYNVYITTEFYAIIDRTKVSGPLDVPLAFHTPGGKKASTHKIEKKMDPRLSVGTRLGFICDQIKSKEETYLFVVYFMMLSKEGKN